MATVSRVLNGTARVGAAARERVLAAAAQLGYQPDLHARMLARGQSRTLGMIVSNLSNPFFLDIFRALETDALRWGYEVVVANTGYRPPRLLEQVHSMVGRSLAGLAVIVSETEPTLLERLADSEIPIAFSDVGMAGPKMTSIRTDYGKGMSSLVDHLRGLGHRRLAFVGQEPGRHPLHPRHRAFLEAAGRHRGQLEQTCVGDEDQPRGGQLATRHLFASGFAPTAIVCGSDWMALGVMRALADLGLSVPEEVSVASCDNISLSEHTWPALTTINVPRARIGHLVSEALMPEGEASALWGREIRIEPELIVRGSTGPAPGPRRP